MAVTFAVGTVYEAKYSAAIASQMIYRAWWTQILLWLFVINLGSVCISRWPWKKHHVGFLITHLGLIVLLFGSWITQRAGIDGSIALATGETGRMLRIDQSMLYVFKTVPGKAYDLIFSQPLDFDLREPSRKPRQFSLGSGEAKLLTVHQFLPRARREIRAEPTTEAIGIPGAKIQLSGSRASFQEWLFLQNHAPLSRDLGPAVVIFQEQVPNFSEVVARPTLVLFTNGSKTKTPNLAVAKKGEKLKSLGTVELGKPVATGWMDFYFTLQDYVPSAIPRAEYQVIERLLPNADPLQAMEFSLGKEKLWLELGSSAQVSDGNSIYYVQFTKQQIDLGFEIKLNKFHVGYYEGTSRPKTYSSDVEVLGVPHEISMNEPLKWGGYTFYQASYDMDEQGHPRYSILSVNKDPGRWVKYTGSILLVMGIVSMFYFRPKYSGASKWLKKSEAV